MLTLAGSGLAALPKAMTTLALLGLISVLFLAFGQRSPKSRARPRDRGDDRSVKFESLEATKIIKIRSLVLRCINTDLCK